MQLIRSPKFVFAASMLFAVAVLLVTSYFPGHIAQSVTRAIGMGIGASLMVAYFPFVVEVFKWRSFEIYHLQGTGVWALGASLILIFVRALVDDCGMETACFRAFQLPILFLFAVSITQLLVSPLAYRAPRPIDKTLIYVAMVAGAFVFAGTLIIGFRT